jgi:hypothetical protein
MRRYSLPPKEKVMLKVFSDGSDDRLRLEDHGGKSVGWIRGEAIGFVGLTSQEVAVRAVVRAWPSFEMTLQREYPGRAPRGLTKLNVRLLHDGAYRWVADGYRPLARLLSPSVGRNSGESFAVEFFVPSYATQRVAIAVAEAVWEALAEYVTATPLDAPRAAAGPNQVAFLPGALAVRGT